MVPVITAFANSPDGGAGHARDMRVRWALEEVGQPYEVRLVSFREMKEPDHKAIQPFGQIPTYEDGALKLFETGSILIHIANNHPGLLPEAPAARARAITWMFAAVSTVEPPIVEREMIDYIDRLKPWYDERLPLLEEAVSNRLADLSTRLGEGEWLDGGFSAADIMMVAVLRRVEGKGLVEAFPNLAAYVERGKARPAYQRAFDAQLAVALAAAKT